MAVPAHDERDFEFAKKFDLPIKPVIEPLIVQDYEPGAYKEGEPIVPRDGVIAIIKHWKEDKYICLKWKKVAGQTFLTGGIEEGQTPETAAIAEIKQETGFLHPKFIEELGVVHGLFYHVPKGENRLVHGHIVYLELQDGEKEAISDEENEIHEVQWLSLAELKKVLTPGTHHYAVDLFENGSRVFTDEGIMVNSGEYDGMSSSEAREKISDDIEKKGLGSKKIQFHLHDWSISRQRYWGTPIPIINCPSCGVVPVPEEDLPVELPYEVDFRPQGKPPLASNEQWLKVKCPKCGGEAEREAETMDGFVDNSWYMYRYLDPKYNKAPFNKELASSWMPVKVYFGGAEHTLGHTLYSRFFTKFFYDLGLTPFDEYALKRVNHGVILGPDGARMSKSKGNVINPDEQAANYGADSVRMYLAFIGPYDIVAPWNPDGINGVYHFLQRVWGLQEKVKSEELSVKSEKANPDLKMMHKTIKKVTEDLENYKFNTSIAALMEWLNHLSRKDKVSLGEYKIYLTLLAPFAPHMTEELWQMLGESFSIHQQPWPKVDEKFLEEEEVTIAIQINGKVRDSIRIMNNELGIMEGEVVKKALESERVQKFLEGKEVKKTIYIPGKIINLVI
jgi:leucyl-tRNA synthetase